MTKRTRRTHSPGFKAKGALAAIKGEKTLADLAKLFGIGIAPFQWTVFGLAGYASIRSTSRSAS